MALSTTEAEYIVVGACYAQILYMKQTLLDYGIVLEKVPLLCDNECWGPNTRVPKEEELITIKH